MFDLRDISQGRVHILLVEDDDGDAKAVERAFRKEQLPNPIVRAVDGVEALEVLRHQHPQLTIGDSRILIVDLNMPRMNGLELIGELRKDPQLHREIVFVLTTSSRDEDIFAAYDYNVAGYITKQRAGKDFIDLMNIMESYWRVNEFPVHRDG